MTEYEALLTAITIKPKHCTIFDKSLFCTVISIEEDDCELEDGPEMFVTVRQRDERIVIRKSAWPILRDAIERMIAVCVEPDEK